MEGQTAQGRFGGGGGGWAELSEYNCDFFFLSKNILRLHQAVSRPTSSFPVFSVDFFTSPQEVKSQYCN